MKKQIEILIVEDDEEICEIISFYLSKTQKYSFHITHSAEEALNEIQHFSPDIILLDINLPKKNGLDLCVDLRKTMFCPIIFISCYDDESTIIEAINRGGDDYLVKPFRCAILNAHIEANLRRSHRYHQPSSQIQIRDLILHGDSHQVFKRGVPINLSMTEYELLSYLMSQRGRFLSFEEVYEAVWQRPSLSDYRSLFVHVRNLRKKIEDDPDNCLYLQTISRSGYTFLSE